jgi:hypothetical protein
MPLIEEGRGDRGEMHRSFYPCCRPYKFLSLLEVVASFFSPAPAKVFCGYSEKI